MGRQAFWPVVKQAGRQAGRHQAGRQADRQTEIKKDMLEIRKAY